MKKLLFIIALLISVQQNLFSQVPTTGQVLKWNGAAWMAGTDLNTGTVDSAFLPMVGKSLASTYANKRIYQRLYRQNSLVIGKNAFWGSTTIDTGALLEIYPRSSFDGVAQNVMSIWATGSDPKIYSNNNILFDVLDISILARVDYLRFLYSGADTWTFRYSTTGGSGGRFELFNETDNTTPFFIQANAPSNAVGIDGSGNLIVGNISSSTSKANFYNSSSTTAPLIALGNSGRTTKLFSYSATPEGALSGTTGDVAFTSVGLFGKLSGTSTTTLWGEYYNLRKNHGATSGQVLQWDGSAWLPATNTSESTTIGAFQSSGNSNGLTLSGTDIKLHAATISTPGGVNVGQQTFGVGADTKIFNGTGSGQITVDGNTDNTVAGINFTQQGTDLMGIVHMNSSDADNARLRVALEQDGGLTDQLTIGTLNDTRGMYSRNGLYEDVTTVTTSPYTVLYGDRNIYLDGTTITVNLQAIGTSTAETKIGRVIYFFNDNATNVTITPNGSETINDSASLTLLPNTGVTLLAVTGTKWVTRD